MKMQFKMLTGECWWGGCITAAEKMPFDCHTEYAIDLLRDKRTQTVPFFLSNKGRTLWSEDPFRITFDRGTIRTEPCDLISARTHQTPTETAAPVVLEQFGTTLREAYLGAMHKHFPFEKDIRTPRECYQHPQFNTWMEVIKHPTQENILQYASEIVAHGYHPGLLVIDGGWQKAQGVWEFDPERFPNPKEMVQKLHEMGFTVLIWASPFRCAEDTEFYGLYLNRALGENGNVDVARNFDHLVRVDNGEVSIFQWWSGFSAQWNFNLPGDAEVMRKKLAHLTDDYGIDGFKFDGGSYRPDGFINGEKLMPPATYCNLNEAWVRFGAQYKFHEFKDTWKSGGKAVLQRLFDKKHSWTNNGINCLIPHGCFAGLVGIPFLCPDMIGGGEWTAFRYGTYDEELFIRMAECSALFPMMQFSSLPWRHMSEQVVTVCKKMAELHERMFLEIEQILSETEQTGEPIIRHMAYQFPDCGYERINDQFMLGADILVAPVVIKGAIAKQVHFPAGEWQSEDGTVFCGPCVQTVEAPLEALPWFRKIK